VKDGRGQGEFAASSARSLSREAQICVLSFASCDKISRARTGLSPSRQAAGLTDIFAAFTRLADVGFSVGPCRRKIFAMKPKLPSKKKPKPKAANRKRSGGLNLEAGKAYLRTKGIRNPVPFVADDFDAPLDDDVLLRPLPRK
jgi:hypothetical protein